MKTEPAQRTVCKKVKKKKKKSVISVSDVLNLSTKSTDEH